MSGSSEMENTDMNNVNNTDAKIKTDALGVLPEQLNGGTTANRQLMAHIGPIRAVIASKLGVKLDHMRISNKMWNVLKELEAEDRINAVKKLEKEKNIYRDISKGNFVVSNSPQITAPILPFCAMRQTLRDAPLRAVLTMQVYMSKEAKNAGDSKTLEETLEDRAARIDIPKEVLAKIDACWRLEKQYKIACTQLHDDKNAVKLERIRGGRILERTALERAL